MLLYISSCNAECLYHERKVVRAPILYHVLSLYAGEHVACNVNTRFLSFLIEGLLKLGFLVLRGKEEEAKNALRDPALRRGVTLVLKGLAYYGVTVPQKLPAPFLIVWNFTNLCNLRCKHCYQRAGMLLRNELSLEEKIEVVNDLDEAGVAAVALSGGEPTIHPDFLHIVRELASRGIYVAVASNGWLFANMEYLEKSVKAGLRYVEISVDSANPRKHDEFRGRNGSWARAVKALENAVKLGITHAMAVTLTKYNYDEVDDILDLAESIGVRRVVFFNFIPTGRGKDITEADLDPMEREKFMRFIYKEMKRRGIEILSTAPQYGRVALQLSGETEVAPTHFYVGGDPIVKALAEFIGGCGAGRIYAALDPDGTVMPCVFMPIKVGTLRKQKFTNIWSKNPLLNALRNRDNLKGFCRECPYRNICGGCRARAYSYFDDALAPDPGCIYNIRAWYKIKA